METVVSEVIMRQMIIDELTQAMQELTRGFAHILPRIIVLVIVAFAGWVVAYLLKMFLRSILRLIRFDKLSENAGASQLLTKAALPSATELLSRFAFWVAWLGFILLGVSVLGILGLQDEIARFFLFLPRLFVALFILFLACSRPAFFPRRAAGRCERQPSFPPASECFRSHDHHCLCLIHGL